MKIAFIIYGSLDQKTGGYIYDQMIVRGLRERGHSISIHSLNETRRVSSVLRTMRSISAQAPDVIVGDELCFRELLPLFSRFRRTPRLLLVHHLFSWEVEGSANETSRLNKTRWIGSTERALLRASDRIVVTSRFSEARLKRDGLSATPILPGADRLPQIARERMPVSSNSIRLLFVGTYTPRKRLVELVDAFSRIQCPTATLEIVGDAARDQEIAAIVRDRAARDPRIVERGILNDRDLAFALSEASALVLPSSFEGYGMVITEALHAGTPVIAPKNGAIPEAAGEGDHVLFVDEGKLLETLTRFCSDRALREKMIDAAESQREKLPRWNDAILTFERVLDELHRGA